MRSGLRGREQSFSRACPAPVVDAVWEGIQCTKGSWHSVAKGKHAVGDMFTGTRCQQNEPSFGLHKKENVEDDKVPRPPELVSAQYNSISTRKSVLLRRRVQQ
jgi:hypothetical protein